MSLNAEYERLRALKGYGILDTEDDPVFDAFAEEAAETFDVPIALISLVDSDRQWFKARFGLDVKETPRTISFCSHAVASGKTLIVNDAANDQRFKSNPLVKGDPSIRFYAGAPLRTPEGHSIGTVCVIDRRPRQYLDNMAVSKLESLADKVMKTVISRADNDDLKHGR